MTTTVLSLPRVNVRLCGSIPRAELSCGAQERRSRHFVSGDDTSPLSHQFQQCAPSIPSNNGSSELWDSSTHTDRRNCNNGSDGNKAIIGNNHGSVNTNTSLLTVQQQQLLCSQLERLASTERANQTNHGINNSSSNNANNTMPHRPISNIEAPSWAVPARGDARLEPVCDCVQTPVDLTTQAVFRIGRSPSNNVQLLHATSSRRHALLFHHSNGSCYIVDCGSAHGTYVNGARIHSTPQAGGVIVPHKIRQGSMIRFGGEGAPCFMLKSFSFRLNDLSASISSVPHTVPATDAPASTAAKSMAYSRTSIIVQNNTRYNALGTSARDVLSHLQCTGLSSKRSFDSLETLPADCSIPVEEPCCKRMRCSSPPPQEQPLIHLVSPDDSCNSRRKRRVTFSADPPRAFYPHLITPNLSADEADA
mmetsp:Transcript_8757/g.23644  ORF Transcript_8757/g.23644 Transcript_8757/m.23644 type:complete len:421 (-) Transcript_8757:338-1600(-)